VKDLDSIANKLPTTSFNLDLQENPLGNTTDLILLKMAKLKPKDVEAVKIRHRLDISSPATTVRLSSIEQAINSVNSTNYDCLTAHVTLDNTPGSPEKITKQKYQKLQ